MLWRNAKGRGPRAAALAALCPNPALIQSRLPLIQKNTPVGCSSKYILISKPAIHQNYDTDIISKRAEIFMVQEPKASRILITQILKDSHMVSYPEMLRTAHGK
jgi:hypothetical protein